jgi:hypothetical protein
MAKYQAWTGQFIDANLRQRFQDEPDAARSNRPDYCGLVNNPRMQLGGSIRNRGAHRERADAGANTASSNSEEKELCC